MFQISTILTFWLASILTQAWFIRRWHGFAVQWIVVNIIALPLALSIVGFITFWGLVVIFGPPLQTTDWPVYASTLGSLFIVLMVGAILTTVQWFLLRQKIISAIWLAAGNNVVQLIGLFLLFQVNFNFFAHESLSMAIIVIFVISGICVGAITGITIKKFYNNFR